MVRTERHGNVVRFIFSNRRSRLVGYSVSTYLVRGVLIDTAFPAVEGDLFQALRPPDLRGVLLTHKHEDHAGNINALAQLGIPIGISDETRRAVEAPPPIGFYRRWTWGSMPPLVTPITPFTPTDLSLVPTPGHCTDHHVVWDGTDDTVFGADLFLGVKVRLAHPNEDVRQTLQSLRRVIAMKPQRLFDGHRGLIKDARGALMAKADWLEETIARIDVLVQAGDDETRIMKAVMGREEFAGYFSGNDYSRRNFVRSVIASVPGGG